MLRRLLLALFAGALVLGAGLETTRASALGMAWLLYDDMSDAYNPMLPCPLSDEGEGSGGSGSGDGADKQAICHNGRTLEVSGSALSGHLGHGDAMGECD